jgi:serine O-acetyltransferase
VVDFRSPPERETEQFVVPRSASPMAPRQSSPMPHEATTPGSYALFMFGLGLAARTGSEIRRDIAAARSRDPATRGVGPLEILVTWPGVQAVLAHRVANALYSAGVPLLPRLLAAVARTVTGIEIHPAARIGDGFFIDHGMGVVVGETAEIGNDVTLYQGVTLGGTGFATGKRHPTVQDNVTIGSGAKLLGPITVGHGSKIGANTVVIHDVPPNSTVVGNPGHPVRVEGRRAEGPDADWVHLPDPIADAIKGLANRISALESRAAAGAGTAAGRDEDAGLDPLGPASPPAGADTDGEPRATRTRGPNPAGG